MHPLVFNTTIPKDTWVDVNEQSREYVYPNGQGFLTVKNVTEIYVTKSGTHYLNTPAGHMIVKSGWLGVLVRLNGVEYPS